MRRMPLSRRHAQVASGQSWRKRLVRSEKAGRARTCRIDPEGLRLAENWIAAQRTAWEQCLDALGADVAGQPFIGNFRIKY